MMVEIVPRKLVTLRFNKQEQQKIYELACSKGKPVGKYLKWYIKQHLKIKDIKDEKQY